MTFRVTNDFTGVTTLVAGDLDQNFTDIENEMAELVKNRHFEVVAQLRSFGDTDASLPIAVYGIPITTADGVWEVEGKITYYLSDDGTASNTTWKLDWGHVASGAWVQDTAIVAATNIAGGSVGAVSGFVTPSNRILTPPTVDTGSGYMLGLFLTAIGTDAFTGADDHFTVSVRLRRRQGLAA